jgi:hypothetical protein
VGVTPDDRQYRLRTELRGCASAVFAAVGGQRRVVGANPSRALNAAAVCPLARRSLPASAKSPCPPSARDPAPGLQPIKDGVRRRIQLGFKL